MAILKVVNADRTLRKTLKADTWEEFIQSACDKLGISPNAREEVKVYTEKDGCEVDDTDVLFGLSRDETFLLTTTSWTMPQPPAASYADSVDSNVSSPNVREVLSNDSPSLSPNGNFNFQIHVPFPKLSSFVISCLDANKVLSCWPQLINETAFFYLNEAPIASSAEYQSIGQQMYNKYPCIAFPGGSEPWSHFTDRLSSKIRNERYKRSKKCVGLPYSPRSSPKFRAKPSTSSSYTMEEAVLLSEEDLEKHTKEMKEEMKKGRPNDGHIKNLIRETFRNRREWLKTLPASQVGPIVNRFPCFGDMKYVTEEYQILKRRSSWDEELGRMCQLFDLGRKILKQDNATDLDVMDYLEKATAFDKGKGKKTQSLVTVKKGIAAINVEQSVGAKLLEPPRLVVFVTEELNIQEIVVTADGVTIYCNTTDFKEALLFCVMFYYTMDLSYPRIYSQILVLCQEFVVLEPSLEQKSSKFLKFYKELETPQRE